MRTGFLRSGPPKGGSRRYLDLALQSVRITSVPRRLAARLALTDGPFAETKEKVTGWD